MSPVERVQMSPQELAVLGVQDLAYVRQVEHEGAPTFGIFAADGTQMALAASRELAFAMIRQNDMEPASVH